MQVIAERVSDKALEAALERSLGIQGGSSGPGELYITFKGAGLKIWASRDHYWHIEQRPMCRGQATVRMAREVYQIADPTDAQLPLL